MSLIICGNHHLTAQVGPFPRPLPSRGVSQGFNSPCDFMHPRLCDNAQSCSGTTGLLRCAIKAHTQTVGRAWILQRTYPLPRNTARHRKGGSEVLLIPEGASSPRKSEEGARSHQRHVSDSPHSPPTAHLELAPQASTSSQHLRHPRSPGPTAAQTLPINLMLYRQRAEARHDVPIRLSSPRPHCSCF